jgi:hypothetical protein
VHTLAACYHREGFETDLRERLAKLEGGAHHGVKAKTLIRVKIEHEPVRLLDILDARSPAVEFDGAHLDAGQQSVGVSNKQVRLAAAVLLPIATRRRYPSYFTS